MDRMNERSAEARALLQTYARERPGSGTRERNWNAVQRRIAPRRRPPRASLRRQLAWGFAAALAAAFVLLVLDRVLPKPDLAGLDIAPPGSQAVHGDAGEGTRDVARRVDPQPVEAAPAPEPPQAAPDAPPAPADSLRATPVTRARAPASVPSEPEDSLAIETRLVARARSALVRDDLDAARAALDEHARRFPSGALEEDRVAYATIVACRRGDLEARRDFLQRYPRSPHRPRIDEACR